MAKNKTNKEKEALKKGAAFTPEELLKYEASKEHIRIEKAVRDGTRREALAEGKAIGLEKGKAIGEANLYKAIANARKEGYSIEAISTIFGLPQEEIIKILKTIQDEGFK